VWNTYATDQGIYFTTIGAIFRWDGSTMKVWPAETRFHMSFVVNGTFYVRQFGKGLMRMEQSAAGEVLLLTPGGERFANTRIYVMLPFDADRILIGTWKDGLYLYDGELVKAFTTEADRLLSEGRIYRPGVELPNGRFGLGTISKGLVVIDHEGRLVEHVNHESGLHDNTIYFTYEDRQGNLWLSLNRGIARVEIGSPFTRYGTREGLPSWVWAVVRHDGKLFTGDTNGLKRLYPSTRIFRPVEFPITQVFTLLPVAGDLLATGINEGVYRVVGDRTIPVRTSVSDDYRAITLHQWSLDPNLVLVGLTNGLALLRRSADGWIDEGRVPGLNIDAWTIAEAINGELWLGTESSRVARVRLPEKVEGSGI